MGYERSAICEWRRKQALRLRQEAGLNQREIAVALDVSEAAVSHWFGGRHGHRRQVRCARPRSGRPSRLTPEQFKFIPDFLWHGAEAYGFRGELWTCRRVVAVLFEEFGLWYSRRQVARLLQKIGWSPQVPLLRAIQRDEAAIRRWRVQAWPRIKQQARREHRRLVFIDESGFHLLPALVRTYAPKGSRPVQWEWQSHEHLSVMGALSADGGIYSLVRQEPLTGLDTIDFLLHLLRVAGERLLAVWDNSPIHRRREVREFLAAGAARHIHVEAFPPYAPELNPVEWLWGQCKQVELANLACPDLEQLHMEFHLALGRIRQNDCLASSFFAGAKLTL
jgi:transposase